MKEIEKEFLPKFSFDKQLDSFVHVGTESVNVNKISYYKREFDHWLYLITFLSTEGLYVCFYFIDDSPLEIIPINFTLITWSQTYSFQKTMIISSNKSMNKTVNDVRTEVYRFTQRPEQDPVSSRNDGTTFNVVEKIGPIRE